VVIGRFFFDGRFYVLPLFLTGFDAPRTYFPRAFTTSSSGRIENESGRKKISNRKFFRKTTDNKVKYSS